MARVSTTELSSLRAGTVCRGEPPVGVHLVLADDALAEGGVTRAYLTCAESLCVPECGSRRAQHPVEAV